MKKAYWGVGLCLFLSLGLLGGGVMLTLAGLESYRAEAFMRHWAQQRAEPDERAWTVAVAAAEVAVVRYPARNGEYEDRLGRVQAWRHFRHLLAVPEAQASREAAVAAYRRSLALRPVAAPTRARLAQTKFYLLQLDAEFAREFGLALEQGPWRPEVLRELAATGLVAWPLLAPAQREQAILAFRRAITMSRGDARDLMQAAARNGLRQEFCQHSTEALRREKLDCPVAGQSKDRGRKRPS